MVIRVPRVATIEEISKDGRVETIRELPDSAILDLKADAYGALLAATARSGRVYSIVLHLVAKQELNWNVEEFGFVTEDVLPAALYSVDPVAVGMMILGAVLASIVAGLVPAWRAANMDPVAALQGRDGERSRLP